MRRSWTKEDLDRLQKVLEDERPLYAFVDGSDNIIECEWFSSTEEAVTYARTLNYPEIFIFKHVGCAENQREEFTIYDEK